MIKSCYFKRPFKNKINFEYINWICLYLFTQIFHISVYMHVLWNSCNAKNERLVIKTTQKFSHVFFCSFSVHAVHVNKTFYIILYIRYHCCNPTVYNNKDMLNMLPFFAVLYITVAFAKSTEVRFWNIMPQINNDQMTLWIFCNFFLIFHEK